MAFPLDGVNRRMDGVADPSMSHSIHTIEIMYPREHTVPRTEGDLPNRALGSNPGSPPQLASPTRADRFIAEGLPSNKYARIEGRSVGRQTRQGHKAPRRHKAQ